MESNKHNLGPLETYLLSVLCEQKDASVRELMAIGKLKAAYTTIMTTLDRLYKKGLLSRAKDPQGRAFRYSLRHDERELYRTVFGPDLKVLLRSASSAALPVSFLVDTVTEHDAAWLDEMERAINRKRQELKKQKRS